MYVLLMILSVLWFIIKVSYRFFAFFIDFAVAWILIIFWPLTFLFGGLKSKMSGAIGAMFRRMGHHFRAIFDREEYHPLKSDGTWDMRFKVNKK